MNKVSAALEREYLPSLSNPDADVVFEGWKERAAATRARLKFRPSIAYGQHRREIMDFYPAANAWGCLVYIHGGYWLGFSKFETSWVAEGFLGQGLSVALINYPLCPEVKIADISASCIKAFEHLYKFVLGEVERRAILVTGHSAGGYLAAAHMIEDWATLGLPQNPIAGVLSLSGIFDVAPLMQTSLNANLHLDDAQAEALNLNALRPHSNVKLALAVGQHESAEFHRQSKTLAKSWAASKAQVIEVKGANHFTIVDDLASPTGQLNRLAVAMARR